MTLPEPIQSPRAARGDMIAAMGGAGSAALLRDYLISGRWIWPARLKIT